MTGRPSSSSGSSINARVRSGLFERYLTSLGSGSSWPVRRPERNEDYLRSIQAEAVALGVEDRIRITGWLEEEDMARELSLASVGLAPYERIAASGSLATLVAAGIPIVARSNAYVDDLVANCPNAVLTYDRDDPSLIAAGVRRILSGPSDVQRRELADWAASRSVDETARRHAVLYAAEQGPQQAGVGAR